jgi:hypothetical protein
MSPITDHAHWLATVQNLHQAAKLLGVVRILRLPHQPNYLEMGLKVAPEGVSTDVLPGGTEVILDFTQAAYVIHQSGKTVQTLALEGKTAREALTALAKALYAAELSAHLAHEEDVAGFIEAAQKAGHDFEHEENKLSDGALTFDAAVGRTYADALYRVFTGIARFRARLVGAMTPLVVWPGHFDLSGLWFAGSHAEESAPHLNFGWSPYGGGINEPYLYAYAYPMKDLPELPKPAAPAYWHTEGWKGIVVLHREIAAERVEAHTEQLCMQIYDVLQQVLKTI